MKNVFISLLVVLSLSACTSADEKTSGKSLTQEEKERAASDTANFTSIQWLDSTFQDIGQVKEGRVVEITYRFKNTGNKQLVITSVNPGCGCTVTEKPEQPIAPGAEDIIRAKFNSSGQPKNKETVKYVMVRANTNPQDIQLSFRAEVTD